MRGIKRKYIRDMLKKENILFEYIVTININSKDIIDLFSVLSQKQII